MPLNIAETFELLFGNNNTAYKALQKLQKESQETDCVYPYMDRLSDMPDSDNSYFQYFPVIFLIMLPHTPYHNCLLNLQ